MAEGKERIDTWLEGGDYLAPPAAPPAPVALGLPVAAGKAGPGEHGPPAGPAGPAGGPAPGPAHVDLSRVRGPLVLVEAGSPCALRLAPQAARTLLAGGVAEVRLASHPGLGVKREHAEQRQLGEWRYVESAIGPEWVGEPGFVSVTYDGNFLELSPEPPGGGLVFDVAWWKMEVGSTVNFVGGWEGCCGLFDRTHMRGPGRDWDVRPDGTISSRHYPHLVLGTRRPKPAVPLRGTWEAFRDIDMSEQGDVQLIEDWKSSHSVEDLKRIVEAEGWSAFTISAGQPAFGHAALKDFPYRLTAGHCRPVSETHRHPCTIWIFTPDPLQV